MKTHEHPSTSSYTHHDKINNKGILPFETYFEQLYHHRWHAIKESLTRTKRYVTIAPPILSSTYHLDWASYHIAQIASDILHKEKHSTLLDMCVSPGGKLISILSTMQNILRCTANDISHKRLMHTIHTFSTLFLHQTLPAHCYQCHHTAHAPMHTIQFTKKDAALFGKNNKEHFDFVLLDAPCTNERQVYNNKKELSTWTPSRCKRMAAIQTALLCAGIDACRNGGYILYITCSLSTLENDHVITRVLNKRHVNTILYPITYAEQSEHGYNIIPDTAHDAGPLYYCLLQK